MKQQPIPEHPDTRRVRPETPQRGAHEGPPTRRARIKRVASSKLVRLMVYYTAARLALIGGLAVVITVVNAVFDLEIPGVLSLFGALLLGFAISAVAFRSLRRRINDEVKVVDEKRLALRNQQ